MDKRILGLAIGAALVAGTAIAAKVATSTGTLGGPGQVGRQNIRGIRIDASSALPALDVHQSGTGPATRLDGPTLLGDDARIEGALDVTGPARFGGGIDMQEQAILNVASLSMVDDLDAGGHLVLDIGSAGTDFRAGGGLTLADALVITAGGETVTGLQRLPPAPTIVVSHGAPFSPTGSLQPISAASGPVTPVLTIPPAGTRLCLTNVGTAHIVLEDTGHQVLAGNWDAGPHDVLCGISDGTRFIETSRSDNSG